MKDTYSPPTLRTVALRNLPEILGGSCGVSSNDVADDAQSHGYDDDYGSGKCGPKQIAPN